MTTPKLDERMGRVSFFTTALRRPEFGALIGALVIFTLFLQSLTRQVNSPNFKEPPVGPSSPLQLALFQFLLLYS
jgi:hypothetical protein